MDKNEVAAFLNKRRKKDGKLIGVAAGNGMTAKYAEQGGADFILALGSGRFRQMGVSSLAGFLPYANSNELVMEFALKELIPLLQDIPVCFGLSATDPTIQLDNYIDTIQQAGFAGINNFPSVGLFDGMFREALEEQGISFAKEVEAIRMASEKGLFTVAFVFDEEQAAAMVGAGADVICVHLGLTEGGTLGAKNLLSLQAAKKKTSRIFSRCDEMGANVMKMIYGGPVNQPADVQFMYDGTDIMGYIGGSVFERIPAEQMLTQITQSYKQTCDFHYDELIQKVTSGIGGPADYIAFIKRYVNLHYMEEIHLRDITEILNLSRPYVSTLFKKEVGISFTRYLIEFRLERAKQMLKLEKLPIGRVAEMVGYEDYAQFSKIFKKYVGQSPKEFCKNIQNDK